MTRFFYPTPLDYLIQWNTKAKEVIESELRWKSKIPSNWISFFVSMLVEIPTINNRYNKDALWRYVFGKTFGVCRTNNSFHSKKKCHIERMRHFFFSPLDDSSNCLVNRKLFMRARFNFHHLLKQNNTKDVTLAGQAKSSVKLC